MENRSILRKYSATLAMIVVLAAALPLVACAKEPAENGIITMTTQAREVRIAIKLAKGADNLTINWGDGKESNISDALFNEDFERFVFTHEYSGTTVHNILITGKVTYLNCAGSQLTALDVSRNTTLTELNCGKNQLTALDVSKNTALNGLECNFNKIKSLDVSKNTALGVLEIVGNLFTATALNDLFRTLPDYSKTSDIGVIYLTERHPLAVGNPGNRDCDRSIALKRGWDFMSIR